MTVQLLSVPRHSYSVFSLALVLKPGKGPRTTPDLFIEAIKGQVWLTKNLYGPLSFRRLEAHTAHVHVQAQSKAGYQHGRAQHTDEVHAEMLHGKPHPAVQLLRALFWLSLLPSNQVKKGPLSLSLGLAWESSCAARDGADSEGRRQGGSVGRGGTCSHIL